MKNRLLYAVIFLLPTLFYAQLEGPSKNYIGNKENKIIKRFGSPTKVFDDTTGGHILVYALNIDDNYHPGKWGGNNPHYIWEYTLFYIDEKFSAYKVESIHTKKRPEKIDSLKSIFQE